MDADDVAAALRAVAGDDVFCGARAIVDAPIHPQEKAMYTGVADKVRRATSTGRLVAREVLRNMGVPPGPILRTTGGAPVFPVGICGSIAHDDEFAVCVAIAGVCVGVDVEPALPLPKEIENDVAVTDDERARVAADVVFGRELFAAKEAVYKACCPVEGVFYEFADVVLDAAAGDALRFKTKTGNRVAVRVTRAPRVLAVARVLSWGRFGGP